MADFISNNGEVIALIEDLDLEFVSLNQDDCDDVRYIELT